MTRTTKTISKTLIFVSTACMLALGAATVYANDEVAADNISQSQVWVHRKTAVSEDLSALRTEDSLPEMLIPLTTEFDVPETKTLLTVTTDDFTQEQDLRNFDLIDGSPLFIGAKGATEFDTRDAQRDMGAYPDTMGINPLYTVAGAWVSTSF